MILSTFLNKLTQLTASQSFLTQSNTGETFSIEEALEKP